MSPFREPSSVPLSRIANFRDLGGHTTRDGARVRHGRLFRSGHLAHASDQDLSHLEELGIQRVFDFRTRSDIAGEGEDRLPKGASRLRLPMPDLATGQDLRSMINGTTNRKEMVDLFGDGKAAALMVEFAELLVQERCPAYSEFLSELVRAESLPALFHCSAGKDRAGWAGSVVLLTLGVEEEQVIEQYLLSNRSLEAIRERLESPHEGGWGDLLKPFLEVRREYIEGSFKALRNNWGSFDRYLREGLHITPHQQSQLQQQLLE